MVQRKRCNQQTAYQEANAVDRVGNRHSLQPTENRIQRSQGTDAPDQQPGRLCGAQAEIL